MTPNRHDCEAIKLFFSGAREVWNLRFPLLAEAVCDGGERAATGIRRSADDEAGIVAGLRGRENYIGAAAGWLRRFGREEMRRIERKSPTPNAKGEPCIGEKLAIRRECRTCPRRCVADGGAMPNTCRACSNFPR